MIGDFVQSSRGDLKIMKRIHLLRSIRCSILVLWYTRVVAEKFHSLRALICVCDKYTFRTPVLLFAPLQKKLSHDSVNKVRHEKSVTRKNKLKDTPSYATPSKLLAIATVFAKKESLPAWKPFFTDYCHFWFRWPGCNHRSFSCFSDLHRYQ